jgi:hypothetical protein
MKNLPAGIKVIIGLLFIIGIFNFVIFGLWLSHPKSTDWLLSDPNHIIKIAIDIVIPAILALVGGTGLISLKKWGYHSARIALVWNILNLTLLTFKTYQGDDNVHMMINFFILTLIWIGFIVIYNYLRKDMVKSLFS